MSIEMSFQEISIETARQMPCLLFVTDVVWYFLLQELLPNAVHYKDNVVLYKSLKRLQAVQSSTSVAETTLSC